MIEIEGKIVSTDIITTRFACDLSACRGICCVEGNSGAPLEAHETVQLAEQFEAYRPYMTPEGVEAVLGQGFHVIDQDGDYTTTLVADPECAYSINEGGVTLCAIEKAWKDGHTGFRKPISCHLYPIRVTQFSNGTIGLNYHRWGVCSAALKKGSTEGIAMFRALREPIIRGFGEEFFKALELAEEFIEKEGR